MASIWSAAAATPTAAHRLPADVSAAGIPTYYSVQQIADLYISTGVTANAIGNVTGATAISLAAGGVVTATVTGNTTFSITNPPTAASEWVLILTNGGAHTITWFTTTWAGGTAPTLTASGVDVIHFATPNGGTTWYGWHETDFAVGTTAGTVAAGDDSRMTDDRTASGLRSATTVVSVSAATAPSSGQVLTATSSTAATWQTPSGGGTPGGSDTQAQYNNAGAFGGLPLWRFDANTLWQRNSTTAQGHYISNTYTDDSNYERGRIQWVSNVLTIGTQKAGSGSARSMVLQTDGATALTISTSAIVGIAALDISGSYGINFTSSHPLSGYRHAVAATTLTSYTLVAGDSGKFYVATSGSDQNFTMPASPTSGTWYGFKVSTAKSSYLRFTANTSQKIRLAAGLSASAGYVRSNTGGSWLWLMYDSTDAEWVAWQQGGTWTIDS